MPSNRSRHRSPSRSAIALVEMVSIISLVAAILSLSATVMHHAFRAHQHALAHFRQTEQLQRLVQRWREDVQLAEQVEILAGAAGPLTLVLRRPDDQQVTYHQSADGLTRVLQSAPGVERQEDWALPDGAQFTCDLQRPGGPPLVILRLEFPEDSRKPAIEWLACATAAQAAAGTGEEAEPATAGETAEAVNETQ